MSLMAGASTIEFCLYMQQYSIQEYSMLLLRLFQQIIRVKPSSYKLKIRQI